MIMPSYNSSVELLVSFYYYYRAAIADSNSGPFLNAEKICILGKVDPSLIFY